MKHRSRYLLSAVVILGLGLFFVTNHQTVRGEKTDKSADENKAPAEIPVTTFMRAKLVAGQDILEGLVTENFDKVKQGAQKMLVMSKEAEWKVIQGPVYVQHSAEFRRSAEQIIKMANDKNIDGAALTYMHMTMNCISCHRYVKRTRITRGEEIPKDLSRALKQDEAVLTKLAK